MSRLFPETRIAHRAWHAVSTRSRRSLRTTTVAIRVHSCLRVRIKQFKDWNMSIAGIASSLFSQLSTLQSSKKTSLQNEFQQLTKDLQAGSLTGAQADFAALQQNASASRSGGNTLSRAVNALGNDLQSGNLTAAQQDFANIQQDVQQAGRVHHHHHHAPESQNSSSSSAQQTSIAQLFNTLGQDLQSGSLTNAQQAYASLQQDLQLFSTSASSSAPSAPVSVSA
jgi:hypothetical protein